MESVKIKKDELLAAIRENRTEHREVFEEALEGWRRAAQTQLEERLDALLHNRVPDIVFSLPAPQDQTKEYDKIIRMLEMSVDDIIELEEHQFAQYVMDDWSWKGRWSQSNSAYGGERMKMSSYRVD